MSYAPTARAARAKVKGSTRRQLFKIRTQARAEKEAERKAEAALSQVPRKWRKQDADMRQLMKGVQEC